MQDIDNLTRRLSFCGRVDFCLLLLLSVTWGLLILKELETAA